MHGARGEDPTEPPASAPYPFPARLSTSRGSSSSHDQLEAAGYHPFHAPCGVRLDDANPPYSQCVRCATCDGFPCLVHAKSDAEVLGVRPALEHANVTLLTNARALKLETDDAGTSVTGVVVERDGETERYTASLVVVSCGAANTAKLLLASANDEHPNGLANGSDQVGRNYMFHASQAVLALSRSENPTVFQKTLGLNDFYLGADDFDFPLGNIQMVGKSQPEMFRGEKPGETKLAPEWTLERVAKHAIDFWLSTEDLPRSENRVTLDGDGNVQLAYTPTNDVPKQRLYAKLKSILGKLDMNDGPPDPSVRVSEERDPGRRVRPPGGNLPLRRRPGDVRPRRELQDARARQPLRRRHELLPEHRRREPGADRDGERDQGRRPPARADGVTTTPRVVILGGGFAGVGAAQKLKDADADVVLVDRHDYHTFQPLLYQLATGLLETTGVGHSLRDLLENHGNAAIHKTKVTGIDLESSTVSLDGLDPLSYDYLVLGLGAEVNFFGTEGAAEHAFPMYTLSHASRLKDHLLERWEAADRDPGLVADGALNVVVVGGGPTGVETAGAIAELYRGNLAKDYKSVDVDDARVTLVEAGPELFPMFKPKLRTYATKALTDRTVEVRTGTAVASVEPTRVTLKSGETLKTHTLVWGAGLQGNELVQTLGVELQRGNRIGVGPDLTLPGHPEVYVVGDIAAITDAKTEQVLPQLGSVGAPVRRARGRGRSRAASRGSSRSRFATATRARWRRSAAGPPSSRCSAGAR